MGFRVCCWVVCKWRNIKVSKALRHIQTLKDETKRVFRKQSFFLHDPTSKTSIQTSDNIQNRLHSVQKQNYHRSTCLSTGRLTYFKLFLQFTVLKAFLFACLCTAIPIQLQFDITVIKTSTILRKEIFLQDILSKYLRISLIWNYMHFSICLFLTINEVLSVCADVISPNY